MLMDDVRGEIVLRRLPKDILDSLTPEQIGAIRRASGSTQPRRHPIDARFSLRVPFLGGVYMVLLVGKELRSPARRAFDRELRPMDRISRSIVVALGGAALLLAALVGILFENSIVAG
ncbi:MAG TPA: hypothetical protein VHA35_12080 [Dongiaceae bacterium]|jgi:hypothetical protein|nr:hypothetical protein [Dongiaceae bacterium]